MSAGFSGDEVVRDITDVEEEAEVIGVAGVVVEEEEGEGENGDGEL